MRIRKRFPSSSLSSLPVSDPQPQLTRSPPQLQPASNSIVQLYPLGNPSVQTPNTDSTPSDPPNHAPPPSSGYQYLMIGAENTSGVVSDERLEEPKELDGEEIKDEEAKSNDTRREIIEVGTEILRKPSAGSSYQDAAAAGGRRWFEGEKVIPLKKRRGSFERKVNEAMAVGNETKMMMVKMKSKTNKKCPPHQQNRDEQEGKLSEMKGGTPNGVVGAVKKGKKERGSVIMEGSRCSRVNGRGWRCCQPTLVGYSLCQHHLGKGRLRSMNSVRNCSPMTNTATTAPKKNVLERFSSSSPSSSSVQNKQPGKRFDSGDGITIDDSEDDEERPLMANNKKKMKLGMVKARTISSLLGQTSHAVAVADNGKGMI